MNDSGNNPMSSTSIRRFAIVLSIFLVLWLAVRFLTPSSNGNGLAKVKATFAQIDAFGQALGMFKSDNGFYPAGSNGLNDLVVKPVGASTNWHPYLDAIPTDPWEHPYLYEYPGKHGRMRMT